MEKIIECYDGVIDTSIQNEVHEYSRTLSWYSKVLDINQDYIHEDSSNNELSQSRRSIMRHPLGIDNNTTSQRHPIIYKLWQSINDKLFDGCADLNGIPESIGGLGGPAYFFSDGENFFEKYNWDQSAASKWTCYLNTKSAGDRTILKNGIGYAHRDSGPGYEEATNYATILFCTNEKWLPSWGGEYVFYGDEDTGEVHPNYGYNIGYPNKIVGHKPGRIIVYRHDQTHLSNRPVIGAVGMPVRIAFRVNLTGGI